MDNVNKFRATSERFYTVPVEIVLTVYEIFMLNYKINKSLAILEFCVFFCFGNQIK